MEERPIRWKNPRTGKAGSTSPQICAASTRYSLSFFADWILRFFDKEEDIQETSFEEITRMFLFTELQLTHTCCRLPDAWFGCVDRFSSMQQDEVCEIQDEEEELILEFESLCTEANRRRQTFPGSFCDFLFEFMNELDDRPRGQISKENAEGIRELGVVLDEDRAEV